MGLFIYPKMNMTEQYYRAMRAQLQREIAFNERIHCLRVAEDRRRRLEKLELEYQQFKEEERQ